MLRVSKRQRDAQSLRGDVADHDVRTFTRETGGMAPTLTTDTASDHGDPLDMRHPMVAQRTPRSR